jgi:hypothetical protein
MFIGAEVALEIPAPVGAAAAVNVAVPRLEGRHEQVAVKSDPDTAAVLFLQPGNILPFILKVIFDATLTVAVMTITVLNAATVAPPASWNNEKPEVSTTFVTVIVMDCVPAFAASSVAVSVKSKTLFPPLSEGAS